MIGHQPLVIQSEDGHWWSWSCSSPCDAGGRFYPTEAAADDAAERHAAEVATRARGVLWIMPAGAEPLHVDGRQLFYGTEDGSGSVVAERGDATIQYTEGGW